MADPATKSDEGTGLEPVGFKDLHEDQLKRLAHWSTQLSGKSGDVRVSIIRRFPINWRGQRIAGICEQIDWIDDPNEMYRYIRAQWGGQRFNIQLQGPFGKEGRGRILDNIDLSIDAEPLRHGKPVLPPGELPTVQGPDGQPVASTTDKVVDWLMRDRDRGRNGPEGNVLSVLERTADSRAAAAERAAQAQVEALRDQLKVMQTELQGFRARPTSALENPEVLKEIFGRDRDGGSKAALETLQRELSDVRDRATRDLAEAHRQRMDESNNLRAAHQTELARLRDENRKELDAAVGRERGSLKDSLGQAKESYDRTEKNLRDTFEAERRRLDDEVKRLRGELTEARSNSTSPEKQIEFTQKLIAMTEGLRPPEDQTTVEKVLAHLPEIAEAAPALTGMLSGLLGGTGLGAGIGAGAPGAGQAPPLGMPMAARPVARRLPPRALKAATPAAPAPEVAPGAPATLSDALEAAPTAPPAAALTADQQHFMQAITAIERAIEGDTHPQAFAQGLMSTTSRDVLAQVAAQDAEQLCDALDKASAGQSALATRRGRQYLGQVLEVVRANLA